jgi:GxxExxY protein
MDRDSLNETSFQIIQLAIKIHRTIGPGLLESVYRTCMIYELQNAGLKVATEQTVPVCYGELRLDGGYRLDLIVRKAPSCSSRAAPVISPSGRQTRGTAH